jgi:quercetin dioxygenase-like cupin family protein
MSDTISMSQDIWYLGGLLQIRAAGADTDGAYAIIEEHLPRGSAPPRHVHTREEEAFLILDGRVTFWRADERLEASAGDFVFLPRGVPHTFRVESDVAHMLNIVSPAGLETFFSELGMPAERPEMPPGPVAAPDIAHIVAVSERYGATVVGPPPAADD